MTLAAVLAGGLVLRLWGIRFGLPGALLHLDEPPIVLRARDMLLQGRWNPGWFHYPSLYLYLQVLLQKASSLAGGAEPFLLARVSSALAGCATLAAVFVLGRQIFSVRAGLLASTFLAVAFLHARESHFATVDALATLWVSLALVLTVAATGSPRGRALTLSSAALMAGLAAGTKYNAGVVLVAPLWFVLRGEGGGRRWARALGLAALAALVFIATTPFSLLDGSRFLGDLRFEAQHYREGHFGFESNFNALYFLRYLFSPGVGEGIVLFSILGLVFWGCSRKKAGAPVFLFLLLYYASISVVRTNFVRNLLPALPPLALLAGHGVDGLLLRWPLRGRAAKGAGAALVAGLVALPLARTISYDRAIAESTRLEAGRWVEEHLPPGSNLAVELYGPEPLSSRHKVNLLLHLSDRPPSWYEEEGIDYLVASSGAYEMALSHRRQYPEAVARYEELFRRYPVIVEFRGETVDPPYSSICPTIRVLAGPGAGQRSAGPAARGLPP